MTRVNLTNNDNICPESKDKLLCLYIEWSSLRKESVRLQRRAALEQTKATLAETKATEALVNFLVQAGEVDDKIATEANWLPPYMNSDGHLIIESPFTMKDQRAAVRVAHSNLSRQVEQANDDGDIPDDMFGEN